MILLVYRDLPKESALNNVHFFISDHSFVNPNPTAPITIGANGIGVPTPQLLANYMTPTEIRDPRQVRLNLPQPYTTTLSVLTDGAPAVSAFVSDYATIPGAQLVELFNIIDQVCFNYTSVQTLEQVLLATPANYGIYVAGSLVVAGSETATSYVTGTASQITVPTRATLTVNLTVGTTTSPWQVTLWLDTALFNSAYPVSTIVAVIPPLSLTDLLNQSITTLNTNALVVARESSALNLVDMTAQAGTLEMITGGVSGYIAYSAKVIDQAGNYIFMPFNLVYKGHIPGLLDQHAAIRNLLLNSGVGTKLQWQSRIPELFIAATYYLLPLWSDKTTLPNVALYPDIVEVAALISTTKTIMYDMDPTFIDVNLACAVATYNKMMLAVVPDTENDQTRFSFLHEHPTYQDVATTDSGFQNLAVLTQQFSINLSNALAVASGQTTNNAYTILSLNIPGDPIQRNFVTYVVGDVQYWVLTVESFAAITGQSV